MKIDIVKPDVIQFVIHMDKDDELYHKLMILAVKQKGNVWSGKKHVD